MSDPESKSIVELTGSVTKDGAVALLLGWAVDPKRSAYVKLDRFGITDEQFRTLPSMGQSVQEILTEQLQAAENFGEFAVSIDKYEDADDAGAKIDHWKAKITEAQGYLRAIVAELSLGNDSQLKYATPDSVSDERLLITLDSLDRWARKVYRYSVKTGESIGPVRLFEEGPSSVMPGPEKLNNMMISLALMVELYMQISRGYRKGGVSTTHESDRPQAENPNWDAIAKDIAKHGEAIANPGRIEGQPIAEVDRIEGQTVRTIRLLLSEASQALAEKLK
jgi:hypothetical protein